MKFLYAFLLSILLIACNPATETDEDSVNDQSDPQEEVSTPDTTPDDTEEPEEPTYSEEQRPPGYTIDAQNVYFGDGSNILTLNINRSETEATLGENLRESLAQSDVTSQNVLSSLQEVTIENETEASFNFSADNQMTSMASSEQTQLSEIVSQITAMYGIETIHLFVENEPGVSWGQSGEIETIEVAANENRGYYPFPVEDEGIIRYITGAGAGENIHGENDELLGFSETLEKMRTISGENVDRQAGISDAVFINNSAINDNQAEVSYSINEENSEWTEEDQKHFENILQLTALDFQVEELHLINEDENTITIFTF
jgi:hypothetical protein